jgi:hypothetical protein
LGKEKDGWVLWYEQLEEKRSEDNEERRGKSPKFVGIPVPEGGGKSTRAKSRKANMLQP